MNGNKEMLKIISNETKKRVCKEEILTPSIFVSHYHEIAQKYDVKVDEESKRYLDKKVSEIYELEEKTTQNVNKLNETTKKAIDAIKENDSEYIQKIYNETLELKAEINKLRESLYKDALTKVYNRKWLCDNVVDADDKFLFDGVIALIDLNYFKQINDTYGHLVGDKVLVFISSQLKKSKGFVVRYGGDEFMIFFKNLSVSYVKKVLNDIREDILKKHMKVKNDEFRVSFSFGVASFSKDDSLEKVVEKADENMYSDKKNIKERIKGIS